MENLNTNSESSNSENELDFFKNKYEQVQKQRDDLVYKVKIEVEKREAFENKLASFFEPMIEKMLDNHVTNFKEDLEEKVYELESRIDDIDTEADIAEMVATELNELIRDDRLTVRIELD